MSAAHTPGPWRLEPVNDRSINHLCPVDPNDLSLLTVVMQDETPFAAVYNDADARLIAAAPELLEALKAICDEQDERQGYASIETYDRARAAIAKATGGAQ